MTARPRAAWGGGVALGLVLLRAALAADAIPAEVRISSSGIGPSASTIVTVRAAVDATIEDRTPGARPADTARGVASLGDTFSDEVTLLLRNVAIARPAAVEVSDDLVSAVRLFPETGGTSVVVFVRRPLSYTVARPSGTGDIVITLRPRTVPTQEGAKAPRVPARVPRAAGTGEVSVDAETLSYDQQTDTLTARGSVTLTRGALTLQADEVQYARTTGIADAKGNVVLTDPQGTVTGESAKLNVEDETGWIDDAELDLTASSYQVNAEHLEKLGGPRYRAEKGVFTTCKCGGLEKPSWSIAGKETDVKLGGLGVTKGATFRINDTPVLWLPALAFPANNERQTGFLMPRVSYSNRRGFQYEQPFYWAIDKSSDATVALDVETKARLGIVGEYRYTLSKQTRGNFTGAYYNEQIRGQPEGTTSLTQETDPDPPKNRFAFAGRHVSPAPFGSQFYLDLFAVSDNQFLREINNFSNTVEGELRLRSTRFTRSRTGVIKTWTGGLVQLDSTYFQDLIDPQELAIQTVPQVRAEHSMPFLDNLFVGRLYGEAINFQREKGYDGFRGDVFPELFAPFQLGRFVNGSLTGRVRETAYQLTDDRQAGLFVPSLPARPDCVRPPGQPPGSKKTPRGCIPGRFGAARFAEFPNLPELDTSYTREIGEVHGRVGSEIARVFNFRHLGLEKIRHSVEPELRYLFVPAVDTNRYQQFTRIFVEDPNGKGRARGRNGGRRSSGSLVPGTALTRGYLFDEVDAINRRNFFSYGFTTRILGRSATPTEQTAAQKQAEEEEEDWDDQDGLDDDEGNLLDQDVTPDPIFGPLPATRELLRASLLHGFDVSRDIVGDSHRTNVDLGLRFTPTDSLGVSYNATWDFKNNDVVGQAVGLVLREPWWRPKPGSFQSPTTIGIAYNFVQDNLNQIPGIDPSIGFTNAGVEDLAGSVYLRLGEYVGFTFLARYDLDGGDVFNEDGMVERVGPGFLEKNYLLRLISRCNCWVVEFGVSDRVNPDERLFRLQVTLLGLGSFGRGTGNFVGFAPLQNLGYRRPTATGDGSIY